MTHTSIYQEKCDCGEPATVEVEDPHFTHGFFFRRRAKYCTACYAKKQARESVKRRLAQEEEQQ